MGWCHCIILSCSCLLKCKRLTKKIKKCDVSRDRAAVLWYSLPVMEAQSPNRTSLRSVCFTGHRELPPRTTPAYRQLVKDTEAAIRRAFDEGARRFYCGGAEGFDLLCGQLVILERERHLDIQLILLLPYTGFGERFSARDRAELSRQKREAEEVLYLSNHYFPGCMALRNRQLVEDADVCIAHLVRAPSGTAQTVGFARQKGAEIVYV